MCLISSAFFLFILSFSGCGLDKKPCDYNPSTWICEDPYIIVRYGGQPYSSGELHINNQIVAIESDFDHGSHVYFGQEGWVNFNEILIAGKYEFSANRFIVYIEKDEIFENKYKTLVFIRQKE